MPAYELFLGGSYDEGDTRIGLRTRTKVPAKRVPDALEKVIKFYWAYREQGEEFKDFAARLGPKEFEPILQEFKEVGELKPRHAPRVHRLGQDGEVQAGARRGRVRCVREALL